MADKIPDTAQLKTMVEQKTTDMYRNVQTVQDELKEVTAEGESDKQLVKITITGQHDIKMLSVAPALLKESPKVVEHAIISAYQDAKVKMEEQVKLKMVEVAKRLGFFHNG
jgi:nucleoid-associated protein EbfC